MARHVRSRCSTKGHPTDIHDDTNTLTTQSYHISYLPLPDLIPCIPWPVSDQLTNTSHSDGDPDPDGDLKTTVRIKIQYYLNLYLNRPDPIVFIPPGVFTTGRLYHDFIILIFFHDHREVSDFDNELSEESDQFRFIRSVCFANLKGTVGLICMIMTKTSTMWISIPLDLSSRSFIPLSRFIRSCRPTPLLAPSLLLFPPCSV